MVKNLVFRYILRVCFVLLIGAPGHGQILKQKAQKISISLGWTHQFQFAGYYAAVEKGYFKEHGFEVELIPAIGPDNIKNTVNGKYDFGIATGVNKMID
jgi:ABC-type nitrate/sulfonate/bicarbonate transport system substrate-binding protein